MGLDVLKELPGYKPILKAVLKEQIQLLVEQLSEHTGEETVVLSANVTDGTLSYLGTESGKTFLEEEQLIKSKFLGFCLKRSLWSTSEPKQSDLREDYSDGQTPVSSAKKMRVTTSADQFSPSSFSRPLHSSNIHDATSTCKSSVYENFLPGGSSTQRVDGRESHLTGHADGRFLSQTRSSHTFSGEPRGEAAIQDNRLNLLQDDPTIETSHMSEKAEPNQQVMNFMNNPNSTANEHVQRSNADSDEYARLYETQLSRALRTFKCSFCDKEFREKTNLRVHERVHTGEKPFKCRVCGKSFAHSSNVKQHERAVHKMVPSIPMYKQQFYNDIGASVDSQSSAYIDSNTSNFDDSNHSYFNDTHNSYFNGSGSRQAVVKEEPQDDCEVYDLDPCNHRNSQGGDSLGLQNSVKVEPQLDSPVYNP